MYYLVQSALPQGSDRRTPQWLQCPAYFNPRPHKGATAILHNISPPYAPLISNYTHSAPLKQVSPPHILNISIQNCPTPSANPPANSYHLNIRTKQTTIFSHSKHPALAQPHPSIPSNTTSQAITPKPPTHPKTPRQAPPNPSSDRPPPHPHTPSTAQSPHKYIPE